MEIVDNRQSGDDRTPAQLLGANIAARRKARGFKSQRKFADALGVQQATLNKIELGQRLPSRDVARAIAKALDYELTELHLTLPELYPAPPAPEVPESGDDQESEAA